MLGSVQFAIMAIYCRAVKTERRFQIEQLIMFLSYICLLGLMNFHIFHISSFSTTSCMADQMQESFILTSRDIFPKGQDVH
jgi:amino acid permease